jgi:hypothetical protein
MPTVWEVNESLGSELIPLSNFYSSEIQEAEYSFIREKEIPDLRVLLKHKRKI